MPNPASGIFKSVAVKAESAYGTAPGASGAQALRRTGSTVDLSKETYQSNEIRTDLQVADFRHGVRRVGGTISGELSPATYAMFFAHAAKRDFAAVSALTGLSITIASAGSGTYTLTRSAGDFLAGGVKVGDVVRLTAGSFAAGNLNKNLFVMNVTALVVTVIVMNGSSLTAEGPIASATLSWPGKKTYVPQSGHTDNSFSLEHWYSDVGLSEVFTGCKVTKINLGLSATGMIGIGIDVVGQNITTAASQYFTSPSALTTTGVLAAVNGVVGIGGSKVATITGASVDLMAAYSGDPVVGSNAIGFLAAGSFTASGQMTIMFDSATYRDAFINETELDVALAFTADNTAGASFVSLALPRCKFGGAQKDDGAKTLIQTIPFVALLQTAGGSGIKYEKTTFSIQDSDAP